MVVDIFFDGACMEGGQTDLETGIGIAVYLDKEYSEPFSLAYKGDNGSNNIAEWCGCIGALKKAKSIYNLWDQSISDELEIHIWSDSQLIVKQFNDEFAINKEEFKPYYKQAKLTAGEIRFQRLKWVPREKNKQADRLSKIALGKPTTKKDILFIE